MARARYIFSFTALVVLSIGVLVYLLDRQPEHVYFIPQALAIPHVSFGVFGDLGNHLPTFAHVYTFILLTLAVVGSGPYVTPAVCTGWAIVDCLFEVGQQTEIAKWISGFVPEWFQDIPFLEVTSNFFIAGTFDVLDIISILLGAFMAYLTILFFDSRGKYDVSK